MLDLLIVFICLCLNAFFSAYEMAFVTVSPEEMEELAEESGTRKQLNAYKKRPERTLSIIQIGITLVGAVAAAVGGTGAVENIEPYFMNNFQMSKSFAEAIAVTIVIIPLTYLSVVFGEIIPKTIALKHPVRILNTGTRFLSLIDQFLNPIVSFLEVSTNFFLKLIKMNHAAPEDESLGQTIDIGNLPDYHQRFVMNLLALKGRKVERAMIPWEKVTYLNFADSEEEVRAKLQATTYSRIPVVDGDVIVGILQKKELPPAELSEKMPWQGVLREAVKVDRNQRILEAFLKMQRKQTPLAIVEDENNKYVGTISIEDILEEIVGDIEDKSDYAMASRLLSNRRRIRRG